MWYHFQSILKASRDAATPALPPASGSPLQVLELLQRDDALAAAAPVRAPAVLVVLRPARHALRPALSTAEGQEERSGRCS